MHILSIAGSTTSLHDGMEGDLYQVRRQSVPGSYEVTFQFNSLMHLASLILWFDTEYILILSGVSLVHIGSHNINLF